MFQNWYDGEKDYEVVNGKKKLADPEEFKDKKFKKNIFNELDYLDSSLWKLALLGEEKVGKENCYKLEAVLASGLKELLYYSTASFDLLRHDRIANKEKDRFSTTLFSGYKQFGKLRYYTIMKFGESNDAQTAKLVKLLTDDLVSEDDFK